MSQTSSVALFFLVRLSFRNRGTWQAVLQLPLAGYLSIAYSLIDPSIGYSQALPTYAPTVIPSQFDTVTSNFQIESGIICPTTTFKVAGFGGNLNAWGDNHYPPYQSASANAGNYGVAAGLTIPLSRTLSDYCKKYAESRIKAQNTLVRNQLINSQFALFKHCRYFRDLGYTLKEDWFKEKKGQENPLSVFSQCSSLAEMLNPAAQKNPRTSMGPDEPGAASVAPISPPPQQNNVNLNISK